MDPPAELSTNHSALDNHRIDPDMESSNHQFNQMRDSIITHFSHSIKDLKSLSYNKELRGKSVIEHVKEATPFINWDIFGNQGHENDAKHSILLELQRTNRTEVLAIRLVESALSKLRFHRLIDNERKRCYTGYKYELPPKSKFSYIADAAVAAPSTVRDLNDTRYCYIAPAPAPVPSSRSYIMDQQTVSDTSDRHTAPSVTCGTNWNTQPGYNSYSYTYDDTQFSPEVTGYQYPNYPYFHTTDHEAAFPHDLSNVPQQYLQQGNIPQLVSTPEITRVAETTHHLEEASYYGHTQTKQSHLKAAYYGIIDKEQSHLEQQIVTAYNNEDCQHEHPQPHYSYTAYDHWLDPDSAQATMPPVLPSFHELARYTGVYDKQDPQS